jgi:hypothetical protein
MLQAKPVYHLSALFKKAWCVARHNAKHHGGSVRLHFAQALKQAWSAAKELAKRTAASNDRVIAEVVRLQALGTREAQAARAQALDGWQARCGLPTRSFSRRAWR